MTADTHPLDPISQALGHLEGRYDQFENRIETRFAQIERRFDQIERRLDRLEDRMWWLVAIVLSGLLAQVGTLVAVLVRAH